MRKRIFAAFVCLCMMVSLVPSMAYDLDRQNKSVLLCCSKFYIALSKVVLRLRVSHGRDVPFLRISNVWNSEQQMIGKSKM